MGGQVIAKCKCGIEATILIGGSMNNFTTTSYFPAMCKECDNVVQVNTRSDTLQCPDCGSQTVKLYNDPELIGICGNREVARDFDLVLYDGFYKCAQCNEMSLRFFRGGLRWD